MAEWWVGRTIKCVQFLIVMKLLTPVILSVETYVFTDNIIRRYQTWNNTITLSRHTRTVSRRILNPYAEFRVTWTQYTIVLRPGLKSWKWQLVTLQNCHIAQLIFVKKRLNIISFEGYKMTEGTVHLSLFQASTWTLISYISWYNWIYLKAWYRWKLRRSKKVN